MKNLLYILITIISMTGCEFIELERDNPFDEKNKDYNPLPEIIYYEHRLLDTKSWYSNQILPGENVAIYVVLKNTGLFEAKNVTAGYVIDESYVDIAEKNSSIGDIYPDSYSIEKENLILYIHDDATTGEKINISIKLTDEFENSWDVSFSLVVE